MMKNRQFVPCSLIGSQTRLDERRVVLVDRASWIGIRLFDHTGLSPSATVGSPPYILLGDASLQAPDATVTVLEPEPEAQPEASGERGGQGSDDGHDG